MTIARCLAHGRAALLAVTAAAATFPGVARADGDDRQVCLDAAVKGQQLLKARRLRDARDALSSCAREVCPGVVRRDCLGWLSEAESALPTIVLAATDAEGRDLTRARVSIDGRAVIDALDGKAIALDPGQHTVRLERPEGDALEATIVARENEKGREVALHFSSPRGLPSSTPTQGRAPVPTSTIALASMGLVATGAFVYFGAKGLSDRGSECDAAHACDRATYDRVVTEYTVATVALGVAVLSIAGAAWTYLARGTSADRPPSPAAFEPAAGRFHF